MASKAGANRVDLWSEIVDAEQVQHSHVEVFYRRRKSHKTPTDAVASKQLGSDGASNHHRLSLAAAAPNKRVSWNRSLSTRGRTSIAVGAFIDQPQIKQAKKRRKPALPKVPKGKYVKPSDFEMERAYFDEVDAFELLEESPSPKNFGTWAMANQPDTVAIPQLCSRLEKWLYSKKLNPYGPSSTLSKILGTPAIITEAIGDNDFDSSNLNTPEKSSLKVSSHLHLVESRFKSSSIDRNVLERDIFKSPETHAKGVENECCGDIEFSVKKLSLASTSTALETEHLDPFAALLAVCGQSAPSKFQDVFSKYCDLQDIVKIGEGTFGEAFKVGTYVCKIVPFDGNFRVNGEIQKKSEELLEEVVLSKTLNCLRGQQDDVRNACTTFIETIDLRVCQCSYDPSLIKAWESWDEEYGSENDHPKEFPEQQCYVVFVLEHGGKDLESFVLMNFDEARTLIAQVTASLAVAEAQYEFEHRDLHWGNVLLSRNDSVTLQFTLEGKKISVKTFGLLISIIDFTLSRINTGDDILFLDLSSDPDLFKGPKGDKQSETYRKMQEVTEDCWEGSFPKTNVLWLQYLVDTLLLKKSFERTSNNERDLRSLKKRMDKYRSGYFPSSKLESGVAFSKRCGPTSSVLVPKVSNC